jgi:hypothetical protein
VIVVDAGPGVKLADLQPGDFGFFYACLLFSELFLKKAYVEVTT